MYYKCQVYSTTKLKPQNEIKNGMKSFHSAAEPDEGDDRSNVNNLC